MLILERNIGECINIGDDVTVRILRQRGERIRIGIEAPKNIPVHREEIYNKIHHPEEKESRGNC